MSKFWNDQRKDNDFSIKLKTLRRASGMKQNELAEKICVSRSSISNYENGTREPNQETLRRIAETFDVLVDYLTGNTEIMTVPFKKNRVEDFQMICKRVDKQGNSIDISGISMEKKIAIIDYCEYVLSQEKENDK